MVFIDYPFLIASDDVLQEALATKLRQQKEVRDADSMLGLSWCQVVWYP